MAERFIIRLEIDLGPWESDYDLLASFGLFTDEVVQKPGSARHALERRLLGVVHEELDEVNVQIQYSRGSLVAWLIVSAVQGDVGKVTWAAMTRVGRRLTDVARSWTGENLGQETDVVVQVFGAPPQDESPGPLILNPTFLLGIYALIAQAALIFVLVWLLAHR